MDPAAELVGYVNGRESLLTGAKYGCRVGGCGNCTVMISCYNPFIKRIRERIAKCQGTQCGFNTPGMISPKHFSEDESLPLGSTQEPIFPPELMDPVQCHSLADKSVDLSEAPSLPGMVDIVTEEHGGVNSFCLLIQHEKLLMTEEDIVAVTLKLPANKVVCHTKRGGGMFEGKTNKTGIMAAITTFAANKHGRVVNCIVEREDMLITGGHHPYLGKYKAGFMNVGRMLALDMDYYSNGGASLDELLFAQLISESWITEVAASCGLAPEKRGSFLKILETEDIEEGALDSSSFSEQSPLVEDITAANNVRMMNMYRKLIKQEINAKALIQCWKECMSVSSFSLRKAAIEKFNSETYWKKKGLAVVPLKFSVSFGSVAAGQAAVLVPIYLDGSVLMTHSGIKMGQGVHTKMIQARVVFDESGSLAVAEYFRISEANIQTDIGMDVGFSINPALDIVQIEDDNSSTSKEPEFLKVPLIEYRFRKPQGYASIPWMPLRPWHCLVHVKTAQDVPSNSGGKEERLCSPSAQDEGKCTLEDRNIFTWKLKVKVKWQRQRIKTWTFMCHARMQHLHSGCCVVHIYTDGSVLVARGRVELGQGVNTKMIEVASHELKIPVSSIYLGTMNTMTVPSTIPMAASTSADANGKAVQ
ncbi:xanthine dehydrogenase/oxidase isoform X2 [Prionailurus iriomotensis]